MKIYFAGDTMSNSRQQNWFKFIEGRLISFYLILEEDKGKLSGVGWKAYKKYFKEEGRKRYEK